MYRILACLMILLMASLAWTPAADAKKAAKQGLQELHDLIGSWKCTGNPLVGPKEERDRFWQEKIAWQWQFKGEDTWLAGDLTKGKHYTRFTVRYLPDRD